MLWLWECVRHFLLLGFSSIRFRDVTLCCYSHRNGCSLFTRQGRDIERSTNTAHPGELRRLYCTGQACGLESQITRTTLGREAEWGLPSPLLASPFPHLFSLTSFPVSYYLSCLCFPFFSLSHSQSLMYWPLAYMCRFCSTLGQLP